MQAPAAAGPRPALHSIPPCTLCTTCLPCPPLPCPQVKDLLREFHAVTRGMKPERIVFYRDGVSEGQFREVYYVSAPRCAAPRCARCIAVWLALRPGAAALCYATPLRRLSALGDGCGFFYAPKAAPAEAGSRPPAPHTPAPPRPARPPARPRARAPARPQREYSALREACKEMGDPASDYAPPITFVIVQKVG